MKGKSLNSLGPATTAEKIELAKSVINQFWTYTDFFDFSFYLPADYFDDAFASLEG